MTGPIRLIQSHVQDCLQFACVVLLCTVHEMYVQALHITNASRAYAYNSIASVAYVQYVGQHDTIYFHYCLHSGVCNI